MKEENPFKQKLYHHTLPVSDALWSSIEAQLPAKVDKKRFPFFWMTLSTVLLTAGISVFIIALRNNHDLKNMDQEPKEIQHPEIIPVASQDISNNLYSNTTATQESIETITQEAFGQNIIKSSANETTPVSELSIPHSTDKEILSGEKIISNAHVSALSKSNDHGLKTNVKRNNSPSIDRASSENNKLTETPFFELISENNIQQNRDHNAVPVIHQLEVSQVANTAVDPSLDLSSIFPDPSCYKFTEEEGKSNISVDLFLSGGFSPRTFSSTTSENLLYAEARDRTERHQYTWGGGARVNWNLSEEIVFRTGFLYQQTGDLFDYTDTSATQRTTRIDSFFAADGSFLYTETNSELIFGTVVKKIHNRYHYLDIPLLASYELCMGRSVLMVNAGPVINLSTSYRGQILNPSFIPQHLTASEANQLEAYKSNVGLSIYLGAGALLPINKNFSGLIEPRFLYRIKPVTVENYPLKEHRHFAGINVGLRYHFN